VEFLTEELSMTAQNASVTPALPPESRYASVVQDHKALWGAVQDRTHEGEGDGLVAAIALHASRALVAYIEYGEDMDFPELRLLDLRTDAVTTIDSEDLIDSPMIDGMAFKDEDAGLLELQFRGGGTHVVTLDFDAQSVRW
jgi:hypothetical protein